jgi:two-component system chemotaxis sensor kinase CheA/chemotaxis protein CheC
MQIDIESLSTFNDLAHEGATQATASLCQLTGIDARVNVTKIALMSREDVGDEFHGTDFVGVQIGFDGAMEGETTLAFDADHASRIVANMLGEDHEEAMARSSVKEIGNIMMSGFIDGWANYLETTIDIAPPEYVAASGAAVLPDEFAANGEHIFVFKSQIEWIDRSVDFYIYMLPRYNALLELMADQSDEGGDVIPVDKLTVFNQMTREGTSKAADNVSAMTGIETDAEVSRISFVPIHEVSAQVADDEYVGTAVELTGLPSGYLLILFDVPTGRTVAETMLPTDPGDEFGAMHESAIEELGNIMTSGFIDGWANVLETPIEHTPPKFVRDMGSAIVDPFAAELGQTQEHAFLIESTMRTDAGSFACDIYALPDEAELRQTLRTLDVDRADETEANVEEIF